MFSDPTFSHQTAATLGGISPAPNSLLSAHEQASVSRAETDAYFVELVLELIKKPAPSRQIVNSKIWRRHRNMLACHHIFKAGFTESDVSCTSRFNFN